MESSNYPKRVFALEKNGDRSVESRRSMSGACMSSIDIRLFSMETNSLANPAVQEVKQILESIAETYKCSLRCFIIDHGIVTFRFDNEECVNDILRDLKEAVAINPRCNDYEVVGTSCIGKPSKQNNELY